MEQTKTTIQWYPGHMAKTKKTMEADLAVVDLLIEVVDARIPAASRNPDLLRYTKQKPHVLLLNKADLAQSGATQRWLSWYRSQGFFPAAINAAQKNGLRDLRAAIDSAAQPLRERLAGRGRLPRPVRAMVIGVPNCGKSTVINALAPSAAVRTGNKPGVTRGRQWVRSDAGVELLDTPGMLWPRFASYDTACKLAVCGCISDAVFPLYQVTCDLIEQLRRIAPQQLTERYKLDGLAATPEQILQQIAVARGLLGPGGKPRDEDAAPLLLQEFRNGKLGPLSLELPPDAVPAEERP